MPVEKQEKRMCGSNSLVLRTAVATMAEEMDATQLSRAAWRIQCKWDNGEMVRGQKSHYEDLEKLFKSLCLEKLRQEEPALEEEPEQVLEEEAPVAAGRAVRQDEIVTPQTHPLPDLRTWRQQLHERHRQAKAELEEINRQAAVSAAAQSGNHSAPPAPWPRPLVPINRSAPMTIPVPVPPPSVGIPVAPLQLDVPGLPPAPSLSKAMSQVAEEQCRALNQHLMSATVKQDYENNLPFIVVEHEDEPLLIVGTYTSYVDMPEGRVLLRRSFTVADPGSTYDIAPQGKCPHVYTNHRGVHFVRSHKGPDPLVGLLEHEMVYSRVFRPVHGLKFRGFITNEEKKNDEGKGNLDEWTRRYVLLRVPGAWVMKLILDRGEWDRL